MTFLKSLSLVMSSQGIVLVTAFANNILITRILGPEGRGYYAVLATTVMVLSLLLGEGISRSNAYLVGRDKGRTSQLFSNTVFYGGAVGFILPALFF